MSIQVINSGSIYLFNKLFANNDITIKLLSGIDPFIYASGGGYNDITISNPDSINVIGNSVRVSWPNQKFTLTGPLDNDRPIIGYHVYYDNVVIAQCLFDCAITPVGNGGCLDVKVTYIWDNTLGEDLCRTVC